MIEIVKVTETRHTAPGPERNMMIPLITKPIEANPIIAATGKKGDSSTTPFIGQAFR
tara:strand:- start:21 stop:191 length:171 start_codon:yes stop_codon:yes gene_type:complete